jgi:hypothetical protein
MSMLRAGRLEQQLDRIGWRIKVHPTSGPFYWGAGNRPPAAPVI